MLSGRLLQLYQEFQQKLQQLKNLAVQPDQDGAVLRQFFVETQRFFQVQMIGVDGSDLTIAAQSQVHAYQTEINKQLRLLGQDVMFLQAARQSNTVQLRQSQILARIETLLRYCNVLLES
jgi:NADPH-dependent glutamate synthase beta subunit-like oxidoreductase